MAVLYIMLLVFFCCKIFGMEQYYDCETINITRKVSGIHKGAPASEKKTRGQFFF